MSFTVNDRRASSGYTPPREPLALYGVTKIVSGGQTGPLVDLLNRTIRYTIEVVPT